jgi:ABC-type transport system involved in multi-copper enzyme maturation permease subunit
LSEFEKLKIVTRYELLKQVRRKRFYGALAITVIAVLLTIGLYRGLNLPEQIRELAMRRMTGIPEATRENLLDQAKISDNPEFFAMFVTSMSSLAILGAVFFAGDAIASEFEGRTGYILFPNPVKRTTIVVGKYLACFIATAAILLAAYLISVGALIFFYGQVPIGVLGSLAIALALACFVISMAFVFSSVLKGGMGATIATLVTYMVIFTVISGSLSAVGYDPWFMPDRAGDAISATYGISFENAFGGMMGGGGALAGMVRASQDPTLSFFVLLVYAVLLFGASIWIANRREMI